MLMLKIALAALIAFAVVNPSMTQKADANCNCHAKT